MTDSTRGQITNRHRLLHGKVRDLPLAQIPSSHTDS
jgi:hypothetical protein